MKILKVTKLSTRIVLGCGLLSLCCPEAARLPSTVTVRIALGCRETEMEN